jgi:hypothetical protein
MACWRSIIVLVEQAGRTSPRQSRSWMGCSRHVWRIYGFRAELITEATTPQASPPRNACASEQDEDMLDGGKEGQSEVESTGRKQGEEGI